MCHSKEPFKRRNSINSSNSQHFLTSLLAGYPSHPTTRNQLRNALGGKFNSPKKERKKGEKYRHTPHNKATTPIATSTNNAAEEAHEFHATPGITPLCSPLVCSDGSAVCVPVGSSVCVPLVELDVNVAIGGTTNPGGLKTIDCRCCLLTSYIHSVSGRTAR